MQSDLRANYLTQNSSETNYLNVSVFEDRDLGFVQVITDATGRSWYEVNGVYCGLVPTGMVFNPVLPRQPTRWETIKGWVRRKLDAIIAVWYA